MITGLWGKKIGMTQVFSEKDKVVPVTVIDVAHWLVTQVKTKERDGYNAVQIGCVKNRYDQENFSNEWLKKPKNILVLLKKLRLEQEVTDLDSG